MRRHQSSESPGMRCGIDATARESVRQQTLSGTVFAQDQRRAVTFGNPRNSALNARLGRMGWPRLPLFIVDHCNCLPYGDQSSRHLSKQVQTCR